MISSNEFMKYFAVMEEYAIKPEAMLLIVRYCIDLKGESIPQNYILQVAKNFAAEGITTVEQIESKLSDYMVQSGDIAGILRAMGSTRKAEPDDYKLLKNGPMNSVLNSPSSNLPPPCIKKADSTSWTKFCRNFIPIKSFLKPKSANTLQERRRSAPLRFLSPKSWGSIARSSIHIRITSSANGWRPDTKILPFYSSQNIVSAVNANPLKKWTNLSENSYLWASFLPKVS